jgi:lipoprotein-releasing system permease protein
VRLYWAGLFAKRLLVSRRRERSISQAVLPVAGIALGVAALIVSIGVMNGFQLGFIRPILAVGSYHVRIELPPGSDAAALARRIEGIPGVTSATVFIETEAFFKGKAILQASGILRAIEPDAFARDEGLREALGIDDPHFRIRGILAGRELLVNQLRIGEGSSIGVGLFGREYYEEGQSALEGLLELNGEFIAGGSFKTGNYAYDRSLAFIALDDFRASFGESWPLTIGVKLADQNRDAEAIRLIKGLEGAEGLAAMSWKEYNRSFFRALAMEKAIMTFVIGLIFLVVAIGIYNSMRRTVRERSDDIALLKAIGAPSSSIRMVFLLEGLIIGSVGATAGLLSGLYLATHIEEAFGFLESAIAFVTGQEIRFFSPEYFYLSGIPSYVYFEEMCLMFLAGLFSAIVAGWAASSRVSRIRPAEVLRNE